MARQQSAVDVVVGRLFERKKRNSGSGTANKQMMAQRASRMTSSARRPSTQRMSRVGARDGAAVFKLIRSGGTTNRAGLRGQMNYIFNDEKLASVMDSSGRLEMGNRVDPDDMNKVIRSWSHSWWDNTRNGNTSHMILSYPASASIDQVENTTRDVLDELLGQDNGRSFDYVAAVHDDKEHHPHVHVIVNRRAPDNTLFNLRSGTELSYERFREAMAEHGLKYGLDLDPTFRFERGITDRQPSYQEQLDAQLEGRAPEQRPRLGKDLNYQQDLIEYAKIGYEALAVTFYDRDDERIARAFHRVSQTLEQEGVDFKMPALTDDDLQRFEEKKELLGNSIAVAEKTLESKDAAARVAGEKELDDILRQYTLINRDAPHAQGLHSPATGGTIYMHETGERPEALREPRAQEALERIERDYGIPADAMTARLEAGASSQSIEQRWMDDDLEKVAARDGLSLNDPTERAEALKTLSDAYDQARTALTEERAINYLPHLDRQEEFPIPNQDVYTYSPDRDAADIEEVVAYYRDNGAPDQWIEDNKAAIANTLDQVNAEREAAFAASAPDTAADYQAVVSRAEATEIRVVDADRQMAADYAERGVAAQSDDEARQTIGSDIANAHPTMPHHLVDDYADARLTMMRMVENERDLSTALSQDTPDPLAKYAERSPDGRVVTRSDEERAELVRLVKENTTQAELALVRQGDPSGLNRITDDEVFARQITAAVEVEMRRDGEEFTREMEQRFNENERELSKQFQRDLDRDRDLGL